MVRKESNLDPLLLFNEFNKLKEFNKPGKIMCRSRYRHPVATDTGPQCLPRSLLTVGGRQRTEDRIQGTLRGCVNALLRSASNDFVNSLYRAGCTSISYLTYFLKQTCISQPSL